MKKSILLIHGWDYKNYYGSINECAWYNRKKLIEALKEKYNVYYFDMPGFGLEKQPQSNGWNLDDYAKYVNDYIIKHNLKIDYLLGYSFGGAVSIRYKTLFNKVGLILISPAILRKTKSNKKFFKTPKIFNGIRNKIRDFYLVYIVKVPEMKYGTKFLRNSYQSIVRLDLTKEIQKIDPDDITIIFGENDTMVETEKIKKMVKEPLKKNIHILKEGSHDVANTHTSKIISIINKKIN